MIRTYIYTILNIAALCGLLILSACTADEPIAPAAEKSVYTLQLAINGNADSRSLHPDITLKSQWCYGDQVQLYLKTDPDTKYTFTIDATGHTVGDPVTESVASFTYYGEAIPNATDFTGVVEYVSPQSSTMVHPWGDEEEVASYFVQSENDNMEHLRSIDALQATLTNCDLTSATQITLSPKLGIIKVRLRGFIYPITRGSTAWVGGFQEWKYGNPQSGLGVVLGTKDYTIVDNDGHETLSGGVPFFDVNSQKDPVTGYAIDDDREMVLYIPFTRTRRISSSSAMWFCVMDEWSRDLYRWRAENAGWELEYPSGRIYTLDLTEREPDICVRIKYVTNVISEDAAGFGYMRTKNMGAKTPTDVGHYFIFGRNETILPGKHYPKYPHDTPFYYYTVENSNDVIKMRMGDGGLYNLLPFTYSDNSAFDTFNNPTSFKDVQSLLENALSPYWAELASGNCDWSLVKRLSHTNFKKDFYSVESVTASGQITTDASQSIGVRLIDKRTGHVVFIPVSDILEPSLLKSGEKGLIDGQAIAQPAGLGSRYALFLNDKLYLPTAATAADKDVLLELNAFDLGTCERSRITTPLYMAIPYRPIYNLREHLRPHYLLVNSAAL